MTNFKFKPGDVICHKASGKKLVVIAEYDPRGAASLTSGAGTSGKSEYYYLSADLFNNKGLFGESDLFRRRKEVIELACELVEEPHDAREAAAFGPVEK